MREARRIAHARLLTAQETMRETFDRRRRANTFHVVDNVWVWCVMHRIGNEGKLEPKYKGPFRIVARVGSSSFVIEDSNGKRDTVNVKRPKLYHTRPARLSHRNAAPLASLAEPSDPSGADASTLSSVTPTAANAASTDAGTDSVTFTTPFSLRRLQH